MLLNSLVFAKPEIILKTAPKIQTLLGKILLECLGATGLVKNRSAAAILVSGSASGALLGTLGPGLFLGEYSIFHGFPDSKLEGGFGRNLNCFTGCRVSTFASFSL